MDVQLNELYPRVVAANGRHTLHISLCGSIDEGVPQIKLIPMEIYDISHAPDYWSHHGDRYEWIDLTPATDGEYVVRLDFGAEQRYAVKLRLGEECFYSGYLYAVEGDLTPLRPFKGDTHVHTNRSDGKDEPFAAACAYRAAGYDFVAITDHGRYAPSVELAAELAPITDRFYVMPGEEVHPKGGSYFHIVSLGADRHITEVFEQHPEQAESAIQEILDTRDLSCLPDPRAAAYRIYIASQIRAAGGVAVLTHPFWETDGEYNMQPAECVYHMRHGDFDTLEVLGGNDDTGNGNNLLEMLWHQQQAQGVTLPVVGSSDCHTVNVWSDYDHFNQQFTLVFAADRGDLLGAIREGRTVAVDRRSDKHFRCVGDYRLAKYARFLMAEYYPAHTALCAAHAATLTARDTDALAAAEAAIAAHDSRFYGC